MEQENFGKKKFKNLKLQYSNFQSFRISDSQNLRVLEFQKFLNCRIVETQLVGQKDGESKEVENFGKFDHKN